MGEGNYIPLFEKSQSIDLEKFKHPFWKMSLKKAFENYERLEDELEKLKLAAQKLINNAKNQDQGYWASLQDVLDLQDALTRCFKGNKTEESFTNEEKQIIWMSLNVRKNYIETGTISMSAQDAIRSGNHKIIKSLTQHQLDLIDKMNKLMRRFQDE